MEKDGALREREGNPAEVWGKICRYSHLALDCALDAHGTGDWSQEKEGKDRRRLRQKLRPGDTLYSAGRSV